MQVFFDFDDVLFDTGKFKEDYFRIFKKHGVSKKIFDECYTDPLDRQNIKRYNPIGHIRRICKETGVDPLIFEKEIEKFLRDTSQYVFNETREVLENINKKYLTILSFSTTNFQKAKIYNSGIVQSFKEIIITDSLKGEILVGIIKKKRIAKAEKIFFIDDRVSQVENVKQLCPNVVTILCVRKEGRYHDRKNSYCDYRIENLKELKRIVNDGYSRSKK